MFIYILQSQKTGLYYIGSSNNPNLRLKNYHNQGKVQATKYQTPWKLIFQQKCHSPTQAKQVEYKLKRFKSKQIIDNIIKTNNCRLIN